MKKYGVDSAGVEPAAHIFININQFSYEKTRIPRFATTVSVRLVLTLAGEDMTKSLKKPTKRPR